MGDKDKQPKAARAAITGATEPTAQPPNARTTPDAETTAPAPAHAAPPAAPTPAAAGSQAGQEGPAAPSTRRRGIPPLDPSKAPPKGKARTVVGGPATVTLAHGYRAKAKQPGPAGVQSLEDLAGLFASRGRAEGASMSGTIVLGKFRAAAKAAAKR